MVSYETSSDRVLAAILVARSIRAAIVLQAELAKEQPVHEVAGCQALAFVTVLQILQRAADTPQAITGLSDWKLAINSPSKPGCLQAFSIIVKRGKAR